MLKVQSTSGGREPLRSFCPSYKPRTWPDQKTPERSEGERHIFTGIAVRAVVAPQAHQGLLAAFLVHAAFEILKNFEFDDANLRAVDTDPFQRPRL